MNSQEIVNFVPEGYRPASFTEALRAMHPAYFTRMVQVKGAPVQPISGYAIKTYVGPQAS